jgi:hypothetical protein
MRRNAAGVAGVIGLVIAIAIPGAALAAKKPRKRAFTSTGLGAVLVQSGNSFEAALKAHHSLNGNGAGVQVGTLSGTTFPITGTDTVHSYFANGVSITKDTYTIAAPDANGISKIAGSGKCAGGTGVHKKEKCTYTIAGTINTKTLVDSATITGIDTR